MDSYVFQAGATNKTVTVRAYDSTTFLPKTGLVFNTAGLTCNYRVGATGAVTALALVTQTVIGAHADGGFVELNATTMPGEYRLDLSDAVVSGAAGNEVRVRLALAGTVFIPVNITLTADDPTAAASTTAQVADAVWDEILSGHVIAGSGGKVVQDIVENVFQRAFHATLMAGYDFEEIVGLMATTLLGKASGLGTATAVFRNIGDTADAVTATVDADGNRSAVTRTLTAVR